MLFACTNAEVTTSSPELKELSGSIVGFKGAKDVHQENVSGRKLGASAGFVFIIFRASTNCLSGFGLCKLTAVWINTYNADRFDNEANYCDIMPLIDGTYYGHLELDKAIPAGYDTNFYVD